MKAIILAAGRGSRMGNLTEEKPKCLIDFRGRPLLNWQLEAITRAGVSDVALVTGYKSDLFGDYDLTKFHNNLWSETNMVWSLSCAQSWLKDQPCIVSYSDIFYRSNAVQALKDCEAPIAITYNRNWLELWSKRFRNPLSDAETFLINTEQIVLDIGGIPKGINEIQGQFMGLMRVTPDGWYEIERIQKEDKDIWPKLDTTALLQRIIGGNRLSVVGIPYESEWFEFDSQSDLDCID